VYKKPLSAVPRRSGRPHRRLTRQWPEATRDGDSLYISTLAVSDSPPPCPSRPSAARGACTVESDTQIINTIMFGTGKPRCYSPRDETWVRGRGGAASPLANLIHSSFGLGILLLAPSPLSLRPRLGLVGTPRLHVLLGLGLGLAPFLVSPGVASLDRTLRSIFQ
jgi:hypothetical protein